jgi:hypothetical protein
MVDTKPTTFWAVASLVCGILGCLGVVCLLLIMDSARSDTTGVALGVTVLLVGFPSGLLSSSFAHFGLV